VPVVHGAVDAWHRNAMNRRLPRWRQPLAASELGRIRLHEARHYPHDAAVVVVAPDDATELRSLAPTARVEVVANGVEAGDTPAPLPAGAVLGFHGSFEAQHNVDAARHLVEDVWPRVRAEVPDARVLLVGRSPGPAVRSLVRPGVELRADVPDARAELADVTVYVAPLVSGWGIKNKVLEAMAAGRPVVTTARGAAGIGAGAGLVEAPDMPGIARQVTDLLTDRAELARQGAAARDRVVANFTWERSAGAIESIWTSVTKP
jgi:glycosyltransferase involved in cell wall biosynthesis